MLKGVTCLFRCISISSGVLDAKATCTAAVLPPRRRRHRRRSSGSRFSSSPDPGACLRTPCSSFCQFRGAFFMSSSPSSSCQTKAQAALPRPTEIGAVRESYFSVVFAAPNLLEDRPFVALEATPRRSFCSAPLKQATPSRNRNKKKSRPV